jgi:glutaminyl-peptide cyclotransferase
VRKRWRGPYFRWLAGSIAVVLAGLALALGPSLASGIDGWTREEQSWRSPEAVLGQPAGSRPARLAPEVLSTRPHDSRAFTQGLLLHEAMLYESTGLYGESTLREVDPWTGEVYRRVDLPSSLFGEGLALVDDRLIQLTWTDGVAITYDLATFEKRTEVRYPGEGWGLCYDGEKLVMSDGSDQLFFRDPETFRLRGQVAVLREGRPLPRLNELECVGDSVYANIWQTDEIVRIDPRSGQVLAVIDASGLMPPAERRAHAADVLNGIAYDAASETFLLTGKLWPTIFEVRFVPTG